MRDYPPSFYSTNRGVAYLDGMLYRGSQDGRVLAYDFKTGKRLWQTTIADQKVGETTPAAPIAWDGLIFAGNASGNSKGGKGRVYALDAKTGKIVWEFFLVPKTDGVPARGPEGASPLDRSTWNNAPGIPISGGGTWTSLTLDPALGELYVPVGNPAPAYAIDVRQGGRIYSPARSSFWMHGRGPTDAISSCYGRTGTIGTSTTRQSCCEPQAASRSWLKHRRTVVFTASIAPVAAALSSTGSAESRTSRSLSRSAKRSVSAPAREAAQNGTARPMIR